MPTITGIAQQILDENGYFKDTSSVNITAQNVLDENQWTSSDITLAKLETVMDNAINYVNLEANTTIPTMSGTSESKITTLSRSESLAVKLVSALMVRAYKEKGPNVGISSLSVTSIINDPHYTLFSDIAQKSIAKLKTANTVFVESLIENAINLINLYTGKTISALSGSAGTKSLSCQKREQLAVKFVTSGFLREYRTTGQVKFGLSGTAKDVVDILAKEDIEMEVDIG